MQGFIPPAGSGVKSNNLGARPFQPTVYNHISTGGMPTPRPSASPMPPESSAPSINSGMVNKARRYRRSEIDMLKEDAQGQQPSRRSRRMANTQA